MRVGISQHSLLVVGRLTGFRVEMLAGLAFNNVAAPNSRRKQMPNHRNDFIGKVLAFERRRQFVAAAAAIRQRRAAWAALCMRPREPASN